MSRRKQSRPRHVDNDLVDLEGREGIPGGGGEGEGGGGGVGSEDDGRLGLGVPEGMLLSKEGEGEEEEEEGEAVVKGAKPLDSQEPEAMEDDVTGIPSAMGKADTRLGASTDTDSPSRHADLRNIPSPTEEPITSCSKCGIGFADLTQYLTHVKQCGTRHKILMPYDPPVNGYLGNGFGLSDAAGLHRKQPQDYGDKEGNDDHLDYEGMDEEDERMMMMDGDGGDRDEEDAEDEISKRSYERIREDVNGDSDNLEEMRYRAMKSDETFLLNLRNRMAKARHSSSSAGADKFSDREDDLVKEGQRANGNNTDENDDTFDEKEDRKLPSGRFDPSADGKDKDPAVQWVLNAAEQGLFGGMNNVTLEPLAATKAAVAQSVDGALTGGQGLPEEVNMFRTMLFQLQRQQMMQVQMIQQMRRQLVASGVNPDLLPADFDLSRMSTEGLASVSAAMSGLQTATAAAKAKDSEIKYLNAARPVNGTLRPSPQPSSRADNIMRDSSPSRDNVRHGDVRHSPQHTPRRDNNEPMSMDARTPLDNRTPLPGSLESKYLSYPNMDPLMSKDPSSAVLTRNPLEILQEKTAASLSSLPLPPGLKPSQISSSSSAASPSFSSLLLSSSATPSSSDSKPYSSSSSISSSALFASSPSLSALQKETDALKPSPILPPLHLPMTPEDYKGYIQRGTILDRSQYASDDPFFKHKCRFCHKVFGSDSALQIHVRSHTGERPFKCNICGNRFSTKGNLKVHFERHKAKYPHIKMDATPVPEHMDRHPNLLASFQQPIPPSVPLPPPMPRMPLPPPPHPSPTNGPPINLPISSSSASSSSVPLAPSSSLPSPYNFGNPFMNSIGAGMSPFGLMPPPPRGDHGLPYPHLGLSLPSSLPLPMTPSKDHFFPREGGPPRHFNPHEASVIKSVKKENYPVAFGRDSSPASFHSSGSVVPPEEKLSQRDPVKEHSPREGEESESKTEDSHQEDSSERQEHNKTPVNANPEREDESRMEEGRAESPRSRSPSPSPSRRSASGNTREGSPRPNTSAMSTPGPSPAAIASAPSSVISWASLTSPHAPVLPSHGPPPLLPPHHPLPPGFPGLGLPYPGTPTSFPLPSPLNPVLSMPGPRLSGPSPFLPPPPPPPPHSMATPPDDSAFLRNSILPTKTIDPSENLEQYMEVQKSETSKLEQLVKNIEQKITDPNQCVVCHRVLSCKSALQMHYRIHTGERPFKCKICGRSFTTKGNLKTHMGVHRAKPALRMMHQCPVCHKQFTNVLVLQQHIRAHTGSMHHLSQLPMLHGPMDWTHRPFGLNRPHPYLSPMHPHSKSLELSRGFSFPHANLTPARIPRDRSHSADGAPRSFDSPVSLKENFANEKSERGGTADENTSREDVNSSRPSSGNNGHQSEADDLRGPHSPSEGVSPNPEVAKQEYDSASFSAPPFGNIPYDAPLAALEEKVKSIDSLHSQTSFEKFRKSMGLGGNFYQSPSYLSDKQASELEYDSASKPDSPVSGVMQSFNYLQGLGMHGDGMPLSCNICYKRVNSKGALEAHYRNHAKDRPYRCDVCDRSFASRNNLMQHMLTHKIKDLPNSAFDSFDGNSEDGENELKNNVDREMEEQEMMMHEEDMNDELDDMANESIANEQDEEALGKDYDSDGNEFNSTRQGEDDEDLQMSKQCPEFQENNNLPSFHDNNDDEEDLHLETNSFGIEEGASSEMDGRHQLSSRTAMSAPCSPQNLKSTSEDKPFSDLVLNTPAKSTSSPTSSSSSVNQSQMSGTPNGSSFPHPSSPTNRRPVGLKHQCMTCMKPFSSASALQIHTRTHTGDKPFKCTVCGKAFTTRGNLKVHMGTHMWNNSPSRRGRRMSIEPPFLLSHMKDNPFLATGFPPRPPPDFFYQYPHPLLNGMGSKMNEISVIQSLGASMLPIPGMPPHMIPADFMPKADFKRERESIMSYPPPTTTPSSTSDRLDGDVVKKHENNVIKPPGSPKPSPAICGELDLSMKSAGNAQPHPPSSTSPPPPPPSSSSYPLSIHPSSSASSGSSSTPSPSNNKENSSGSALDLRNMGAVAPWLWGALPCHHCGQVFSSQDALEHHIRSTHFRQAESASAHHLSANESHPPPKALLA